MSGIVLLHVTDVVQSFLTVLTHGIESERCGAIQLTEHHLGQTNKDDIFGEFGVANFDIELVQ